MLNPFAKHLTALTIAALAHLVSPVTASADTGESVEERVTFYSTYGYLKDGQWRIPLRIWIREDSGATLRLVAKGARLALRSRAELDDLSDLQKERFNDRVENFIADNESGEEIVFVFDNDPAQQLFQLKGVDGDDETDRNGLIEGVITLTEQRARTLLQAQNSDEGWLTFHAVSQEHGGSGKVRLVEPEGVSVISDIDDTIKITGITESEAIVLKNTFFKEFEAAPCMVEMYRGLGQSTAFHYVSGSPWQLYEPLVGFLFEPPIGFPAGSLHMKNVRTNPFESESYQDIWKLIAAGSKQVTFDQKIGQISTILNHFPGRRFILIGDSGERDPEIFSTIRTRFPEQIQEIRIRDVTKDAEHNPERLDHMTVIAAEGSCDRQQG